MGFWSGVGSLGKGIGKLGLGVAQVAGATTIGASKAIGHLPAKNMFKNPGLFAGAVGVGALGGALIADAAGEDTKKGALAMGTVGFGLASVGGAGLGVAAGAGTLGAVIGGAGVISNLGSKMIKPKAGVDVKSLSDFKLSGFGKAALGIGLIASGTGKAYKTFEKSRMGMNDGMLRSATPVLPQVQNGSGSGYMNNAGATGDLVFSMFNNR